MIATTQNTHKPSHQETAMQAYFLWEKNGRPWGEEEAFWFKPNASSGVGSRPSNGRTKRRRCRPSPRKSLRRPNLAQAEPRPKPAPSRWKLRLQQEKAQAGCSQRQAPRPRQRPPKASSTRKKAAAAKKTAKAKQQSKRFQAGSIDSPDPEGKLHSRPGVTSFTSGLFHGQGYTSSCVHGLTFLSPEDPKAPLQARLSSPRVFHKHSPRKPNWQILLQPHVGRSITSACLAPFLVESPVMV